MVIVKLQVLKDGKEIKNVVGEHSESENAAVLLALKELGWNVLNPLGLEN